ncbi:MAG: DUF2897 family protein [Parashewanella sp.]
MSTLEVWLIILLVIGVVVSNLAVLKYSAKFKMTQFKNESTGSNLNVNTTDKNKPNRKTSNTHQ